MPGGKQPQKEAARRTQNELDIIIRACIDSNLIEPFRSYYGGRGQWHGLCDAPASAAHNDPLLRTSDQGTGPSASAAGSDGTAAAGVMTWDRIASLVPNVTREQCQARYLELTRQNLPVAAAMPQRTRPPAQRSAIPPLRQVSQIGQVGHAHTGSSSNLLQSGQRRWTSEAPSTLPDLYQTRSLTRIGALHNKPVSTAHSTKDLRPASKERAMPSASATPRTQLQQVETRSSGGREQKTYRTYPGRPAAQGTNSVDREFGEPIQHSLALRYSAQYALILVKDSNKHQAFLGQQSFRCPLALLLKKMPFFVDWEEKQNTGEDDAGTMSAHDLLGSVSGFSYGEPKPDMRVQICCRLDVFTWLFQYIHHRQFFMDTDDKIDKPELEAKSLVYILRSAQFLKMSNLVDECIEYAVQNLNEVVRCPMSDNSLDAEILGRLSERVTLVAAIQLTDHADVLESKLFRQFTRQFFYKPKLWPTTFGKVSTLFRCKHCQRVMTTAMQPHLICVSSRASVNQQGKETYAHTRSSHWNPCLYLATLLAKKLSWKAIFWRFWGHLHMLSCGKCSHTLTAAEFHTVCRGWPLETEHGARAEPDSSANTPPTATASADSRHTAESDYNFAASFDVPEEPRDCNRDRHVPKYSKELSSIATSIATPASGKPRRPLPQPGKAVEVMRSKSLPAVASTSVKPKTNLPRQSLPDMSKGETTREPDKDTSQQRRNFDAMVAFLKVHGSLICESKAELPNWNVGTQRRTSVKDARATGPGKVKGQTQRAVSVPDAGTKSSAGRQQAPSKASRSRSRLPPEASDFEEDLTESESESESESAQPAPVEVRQVKASKSVSKRRQQNIKRVAGYEWMANLSELLNVESMRENGRVRFGHLWDCGHRDRRGGFEFSVTTARPAKIRPPPSRCDQYSRLSVQFRTAQRLRHQQQQRALNRRKKGV